MASPPGSVPPSQRGSFEEVAPAVPGPAAARLGPALPAAAEAPGASAPSPAELPAVSSPADLVHSLASLRIQRSQRRQAEAPPGTGRVSSAAVAALQAP